jgi:hypothetical protein
MRDLFYLLFVVVFLTVLLSAACDSGGLEWYFDGVHHSLKVN